MHPIVYLVPALGVLALLYTALRSAWVTAQSDGDERMKGIAGHIAEGALAFLKAEYRILAIFAVLASIALYLLGTADERRLQKPYRIEDLMEMLAELDVRV